MAWALCSLSTARNSARYSCRRDRERSIPCFAMPMGAERSRLGMRTLLDPECRALPKATVDYLSARDLCLIAPFSRYTIPFGVELQMNSATMARAISSCSIVPKGPGIRRPNQAIERGV